MGAIANRKYKIIAQTTQIFIHRNITTVQIKAAGFQPSLGARVCCPDNKVRLYFGPIRQNNFVRLNSRDLRVFQYIHIAIMQPIAKKM